MRLCLLTAVLPVVLALSALVLSAPVDTEKHVTARGGTSFANCPSGDSILVILEKLQPDLLSRYTQIDDHIQANVDPTEEIRNIIPLFNAATTQISDLPMDKPCVFDGKYHQVVEIFIVMLSDFAKQFAKLQVHRTRDINSISTSISEALRDLVAALRTLLENIIRILQKLLPTL
ncbi:hypothetical protein RhiTH_009949 [Rhizoctonia solani]